MSFYYQHGDRILQEGDEENSSLCEGEAVSINGEAVESSNRYDGDGHDGGDLGW